MSNFEANNQEKVTNPEGLAFLKRFERLKYLYLINTVTMYRSATNLQGSLNYKEDGKMRKDIITSRLRESIESWRKLIAGGLFPESTSSSLESFTKQTEIFIGKIQAVDLSREMSDVEKDDIQNTAKLLIGIMDEPLSFRPEETS